MALCMHREDVEDELRAVDDPDLREERLEVALLARRQLLVEYDHRRTGRGGELLDLLRLARADEGARIRALEALGHAPYYRRAGSIREAGQFGEVVIEGPAVGSCAVDAHEDRPFVTLRDDLVAISRHTRGVLLQCLGHALERF